MATNIPVGSALARKIYSVGLFTRVQHAPGFMNLLSGEMPKEGSFAAKTKGQTSPDYPIVKAGDLAKGAGDTVSIDLFNILQGKPVMGDTRIAGRMMQLTFSSMDVKIDQVRGGADSGGRMTQKRTVHNLRNISMAGLQAWMQRLEDQTALVHLAGARGSQNTSDWVVPLANDNDFSTIMVNAVRAPTRNRHYFANDATSPATIGTNDALTLQDIDRIVAQLRESPSRATTVPGTIPCGSCSSPSASGCTCSPGPRRRRGARPSSTPSSARPLASSTRCSTPTRRSCGTACSSSA